METEKKVIKTKYTEKCDNYSVLSIFIDNVERYHVIQHKKITITQKEYALTIVRNGNFRMDINGKCCNMQKNDAFFVRKGCKMALEVAGEEEGWIVMIEFAGSGVEGMLNYLEFPEALRFDVSGNMMAVLLDNMIQSWEAREYFRSAILLQSLMIGIKDTEQRDYRISNLNEIYEYIQEHYSEELDLNRLAQVYGTSVSYFSRTFKEYFGVSPMTFVNQVRIHYARIWLTTTSLRIREVAERCGYEKMEYFCYVFKKSEGCTPSQYRANRHHADRANQIKNRE